MQAGIPPAACPDDLSSSSAALWELVSSCWAWDPNLRPRAHDLLVEADVAEISP